MCFRPSPCPTHPSSDISVLGRAVGRGAVRDEPAASIFLHPEIRRGQAGPGAAAKWVNLGLGRDGREREARKQQHGRHTRHAVVPLDHHVRFGSHRVEVARLGVSSKAVCNATGVALGAEPISRHWRRTVAENTLFLGPDVHKKTISVATVDSSAGAEVRFYGTIANTPDAIRVLCKKLSKDERHLHACYEAGPCGYNAQRHFTRLGYRCEVVRLR